eukprot:NODE_877_length_1397_cov_112.722552_g732_i0.p1 GENE.NODE_877_length_1397_cov_112.722552_g732_i0~~NODE_877_length_1397_cov_112.722552_g732_i0.p1  ORF type:complete len:235 (-),score=42.94 NODE_877_length_1397_cov_112.722552_g732_i0:146-850(-)
MSSSPLCACSSNSSSLVAALSGTSCESSYGSSTSASSSTTIDQCNHCCLWWPKPVTDIAHGVDGINENVCLVLMCDGCEDSAKDSACAALNTVATKYVEAARATKSDPEFLFFAARSGAGPVPKIRSLCKQPAVLLPHEHPLETADAGAGGWGCDGCGESGKEERFRCEDCDFDYCGSCNTKASEEKTAILPKMLLLDVGSEGFYDCDAADITVESINSFLDAYKGKSLTLTKF